MTNLPFSGHRAWRKACKSLRTITCFLRSHHISPWNPALPQCHSKITSNHPKSGETGSHRPSRDPPILSRLYLGQPQDQGDGNNNKKEVNHIIQKAPVNFFSLLLISTKQQKANKTNSQLHSTFQYFKGMDISFLQLSSISMMT